MAEAALSVIGVVSAIITIIDTIMETYKLARDAESLPEAFAAVNERMPVLRKTLSLIDSSYRGSEDEQAIQDALITCKTGLEDLKYIFTEVCSVDGDTMMQKYRKALRTLKPGRGARVENLFRRVLDSFLALQAFHVFKTLIPFEDLNEVSNEMESVEPSIPDGINTTIRSSGPGAVVNSGFGAFTMRQQIGDGGYQAETMTFNNAPDLRAPLNPTMQFPFHDPQIHLQLVSAYLQIPRPNAIAEIERKLSRKPARTNLCGAVVIYGIGGTGKTQLVLQYVKKHWRDFSVVVWLSCGEPEEYVRHCSRLCRFLHLGAYQFQRNEVQKIAPQRSDSVDEFLSWLAGRQRSDNWLVVLDNVNDSWGIRDRMPKGPAGNLIVTSRSSHIANTIGCGSIHLDSMETGEAQECLLIAAFPTLQCRSNILEEHCAKLAESLNCHPLAIHLAAVTIANSPQLKILDEISTEEACKALSAYLNQYDGCKDELFMRPGRRNRDSRNVQSILGAFEATFQGVKAESNEDVSRSRIPAMKLLILLAFLTLKMRLIYIGNLIWPILVSKMTLYALTTRANTSPLGFPNSSLEKAGLATLERWGLVRAGPTGFPKILPLHKIINWRARKEVGAHERMLWQQYAILLESGNKFASERESDTMDLMDELTDVYYKVEDERFGHEHPGTMRSLSRLINILEHHWDPTMPEKQIFTFIRDTTDRQAVLKALPANLLRFLMDAFERESGFDDAQPLPHNKSLSFRHTDDGGMIEMNPFGAYIGAGKALQSAREAVSTLSARRATRIDPELHMRGLRDQLATNMKAREQALHQAAKESPDLVTLFEVLAMGSESLISSYAQYIDRDTVRFRDPFSGRTILHYLAAYGRPQDVQRCITGRREVFKTLTAANGNAELKDHQGQTASHYLQKRISFLHDHSLSSRDPILHRVIGENAAETVKGGSSRQAYVESGSEDSGDASPAASLVAQVHFRDSLRPYDTGYLVPTGASAPLRSNEDESITTSSESSSTNWSSESGTDDIREADELFSEEKKAGELLIPSNTSTRIASPPVDLASCTHITVTPLRDTHQVVTAREDDHSESPIPHLHLRSQESKREFEEKHEEQNVFMSSLGNTIVQSMNTPTHVAADDRQPRPSTVPTVNMSPSFAPSSSISESTKEDLRARIDLGGHYPPAAPRADHQTSNRASVPRSVNSMQGTHEPSDIELPHAFDSPSLSAKLSVQTSRSTPALAAHPLKSEIVADRERSKSISEIPSGHVICDDVNHITRAGEPES
ncbi:hypothetical protein Q7P37_002287 [Cladosporium fusiforme]